MHTFSFTEGHTKTEPNVPEPICQTGSVNQDRELGRQKERKVETNKQTKKQRKEHKDRGRQQTACDLTVINTEADVQIETHRTNIDNETGIV